VNLKVWLRNKLYYIIGIGFLGLAKVKHVLQGYSTPKELEATGTAKSVAYDIGTAEELLIHFQKYTHSAPPPSRGLEGKNILELGPGSDLGVGIFLLSKGCAQYNAIDVNNLVQHTPLNFYESFIETLRERDTAVNAHILTAELKAGIRGIKSRIRYAVRPDFAISAAFPPHSIDLVFSKATFEHFDDVNRVIRELGRVCKPGAVLISEIDLLTHSRWIRHVDPNNIYRYSNHLYHIFRFRGIPNRMRPFQYREILERSGWTDVSITPITKLDDVELAYSGMHRQFSECTNQMEYSSILLCARKE
jgi:SAM-dependent methyltransferase